MTRRILQQEVEDYGKEVNNYERDWQDVMGPYNASVGAYNSRVGAWNAQGAAINTSPYTTTYKQRMAGAHNNPNYNHAAEVAKMNWMRAEVRKGRKSKVHPADLTYQERLVQMVTVGRPTAPTKPNEPDAPGRGPSFTQAQQRKLNSAPESRSAEVRDEGRSTLERTQAASNWSPFAASNAGEGVLMRAMKNRL